MEIFPPEPPTALQSCTSPVKICSTCFLVSLLTEFPEFTITAMPVVDPSAAMSNVVPECSALKCSANCGTSLAPSVSEPLMTRRSAFALAMPVATSARLRVTCLIFIGVGWFFLANISLEFHVHISLKDLKLVLWIDRNLADAPGAETTISTPGIGPGQIQANGVGEHVPGFHGYSLH